MNYFIYFTGVDQKKLGNIDGYNMWPHISEGQMSPRDEILYNIDTIDYPYAAVRKNKWKYVNGANF